MIRKIILPTSFLLLSFLSICTQAFGHGGDEHKSGLNQHIKKALKSQEIVKFVANQGQWDPHIRYRADVPGGRVFAEPNRLTFVYADLEGLHDKYYQTPTERDYTPISFDAHAFRIEFQGAVQAAPITGSRKYKEYHNYYQGKDQSKWATEVPLYKLLTYQELYPGIDMLLYGLRESIRYDFVVSPGSDPGQIKMVYDGVDSLYIQDGMLHIVTSVNHVSQEAPIAIQQDGETKTIVPVEFALDGNTVSFNLPEGYDSTKTLLIDPLVFSSYTGSTADNFGYTATYDDQGNLYGGGIAFGLGYPVSTGAFQTTFGGGGAGGAFTPIDISITKFSPNGTAIVYSTFLGGSNNEQPHSMITNPAGDLFVYGRTYSTDYPVTVGAYDVTSNGGADIVVTRFNAGGTALLGSTYVGGSGEDATNISTAFFGNSLKFNYGDDARGEIMLDQIGNVYIASCTQSQNFPTVNAFQNTFGGGTQDGVIFKMDAGLTNMIYSSYLGGTQNDAAYSVKVDTSFQAYIAGGTESQNFPTTANASDTSYGGAIDGFITKLNATGTSVLASSFIGTSAYDQSYFVELDQFNNVYLYGQTLGNFPVTTGVYTNAGGTQFIMQMDQNLSAVTWSTRIGSGTTTVNISPTAFLVDICGFIYIAGWGGTTNFQGSTQNMPITNNAFQTTTDGSDLYLMVLEPNASALDFATYIGGAISAEHVDGGTSRFDPNLIVYHAVCGGCGGNSDFPTQTGVVSTSNNSSNCNLAVFKYAFQAQQVISAFSSTTLDSCAPFPVNFSNQSSGGVSYLWDFGDGSPLDTAFAPSHTYQFAGTYQVKLTVIDSNSCNVADSVINTITVYPNPSAIVAGGGTVCAGGSLQLQASGGQFYSWSPAASLNNPNVANPIASPQNNTTYQVIVTDSNGCVDTNFVTVNVTRFNADAGPPTSFCEGGNGATLVAGSPSGGQGPFYYEWWCDSTHTNCGIDSIFDNDPRVLPDTTTTYYLQVTDINGCKSEIDSVVVTVLPLPIANAGPDKFICPAPGPGAKLNGSFSNAPGPYTQYWIPGTGLNDSTIIDPYARPDTTTIYTLVGTSANGCSSNPTTLDTLSTVTVHVKPRPQAEAGPDRDICAGDTIRLQGFGFGAGPGYSFEWSPFTGLSDSTLANPLTTPDKTTNYILTVWSNGCPSYGDTVTVFVHALPTVDAGPNIDVCLGDSVQLDGRAWGDSTATYSYFWSPPDGLSNPLVENPMASPDSTTIYTINAVSSWGCVGEVPDQVVVKVTPSPLAEAGPLQEICEGDSIQLFGSFSYTSTDPANPSQVYYSWTPGLTMDDTTRSDPTIWPPSSTVYYLTVTHNNCSTTDSVTVQVIEKIIAMASADTTRFCQGDSIQLTGTGGRGNATFSWTPAASLNNAGIPNPMAAPDTSLTYTLIVTEGPCADTTELDLEVIPTPISTFINSLPEGCTDLTVHFVSTADNTIQHIWNFGDGSPVSNEINPVHTYTTPGQYTVFLTSVNTGGCIDTSSTLTVTVGDVPNADFTSNPGLPYLVPAPNDPVSFIDQSFNATSWFWNFGDGSTSTTQNPSHTFPGPGEYMVTLTVTTPEGCISTINKGPYIIFPPELSIPNVFSPNEDGNNDRFLVDYSGNQNFRLQVYDRWGAMMYNGSDKLSGWDGLNLEGEAAPEGVYYYLVEIGEKAYTGYLTLVR